MQRVFHSCLVRFFVRRLQQVCCLGFLALALAIQGSAAELSTAKVAPPDDWVKPQFYDRQATTTLLDSSANDHLLLLERQVNVLKSETFVHSIQQILTPAGVQQDATLTVNFNPSYQSLTLHWARIWRGTQHLERLDTNQVKVVQPEREMDQYILNGQKSAILVLDDVRVGDIIDYSYSVTGTNPVFGGYFSSAIPVQMEEPAERLLTRVLWPSQRHLYARAHGCSVQPTVIAGKETTEYVWDVRQMPGIASEDLVPAWYDPQPWIQLSEFKTWADVGQWASALFPVTPPLSPELTNQIAGWKRVNGKEMQVLMALRFVQEQVRYFGIEIGASAEKPADPSTVFARRFGDCKDKSLLFVTILRALGIEAYPVLVNSTSGRAIESWQPTASAFDHCITVVRFEGQVYWLDPTMNYQRGTLAAHYLPDYGRGLVISPKTTALAVIPHTTGLPRSTTTEYFQLRGRTEAAELKVVSLAEGGEAERLRELFAGTKRSDIEKNYTHFYSDLYPGIKMSAPIAFTDDQQLNRVQTTEFYTIDAPWTQLEKTQKYRCEFTHPLHPRPLPQKTRGHKPQVSLGTQFSAVPVLADGSNPARSLAR